MRLKLFRAADMAGAMRRVRAELGHPAPFHLKYLGLGNEEHDTTAFRTLFPRFVQAIRTRHPEILIVGTSGLGDRIPLFDLMRTCGVDITDEHYYPAPEWFIANRHRFDRLPRGTPRVYIGEYGARNAASGNTLFAALAEAVYLTGVERNADQVVMTAYAPLLGRYGSSVSRRVLIWFDAERLVLTPNYHVQRLFSTNVGDRYLASSIAFADPTVGSAAAAPALAVSATRVTPDGTLYLKIVNPTEEPFDARIVLEDLAAGQLTGERMLMTGSKNDMNDRSEPNRVAPVATPLTVNSTFATSVPAMSLQVLRLAPSRR